jgi:eukaryotic-like serine/threonine-protein kinase
MEKDPPSTSTATSHASAGVPLPGVERYGRYCLIERIGRGGMAEVFRAVAEGVEGFRRVFVIKRLRPEKSASVELTRMFVDEARLSALLHHPNIVQVYDFGQINGTYFLAMEYLRGKDLAAVMKALRAVKSAVLPPIAAHIAHQVATGLHYAHTLSRVDGRKLSVVHRDVTPSNIMLQRTGAVKVLDFGIAQATNFARQTETGGGRVKGKLAYLSPEQVRLEELDARSDVFALGVVLWEMLTGQRLFSAENEVLTMRAVLGLSIAPPSSKRPTVPPALDAIVARALERDRNKRYASAGDLAEDLERFLQEAPCHSTALGRLLHDLFGEEPVEETPDFAALGVAAGTSRPNLVVSPSPSPPAAYEMEADVPPPTAAAELAAMKVPVALAAPTPASESDSASEPLPDPRPLMRRLIAGAAGVTLIACFAWAMGHRTRPTAVTQIPAPSWPAPAANVAAAPGAPPAEPPVAVAAEPVNAAPAAAAPATPRTHVAKKRQRRLSSDVTIDPFK